MTAKEPTTGQVNIEEIERPIPVGKDRAGKTLWDTGDIRAYRELRGVKQTEAALRADVPQSTIALIYEAGTIQAMGADKIAAYCDAIDAVAMERAAAMAAAHENYKLRLNARKLSQR